MKRLTLLVFLFIGVIQCMNASHLFVSPSGNDMNDGSKKRPLHSLTQALIKARQMSRKDTLFIHLADGVYSFDETIQLRTEDSGTAKSPTVIMAETPGKVTFSGGRTLDMSDRMETLNWWMGHPVFGQSTQNVRQLWRGETKIPHASLGLLDSLMNLSGVSKDKCELLIPVESFDPVLDLIYGTRLGMADDEKIMNEVKTEELRSLELIACTQNTMAAMRVKNFRIDGKNVCLTFHEPESRLLFSQQEMPKYYNMKGGYSLVYPGTWYQDPNNGSIVYDPEEEERESGNKQGAPFIYPVLESLFEIRGEAERPVHHIIFRGISFQYTSWNHVATSGVVTAPGGAYRRNSGYEDRQESAISIQFGQNIDFADCQFSHLGATAIDYEPGCSNCSVTGCQFFDIGGSAIATPVNPAHQGFRVQRNTFDNIANEIWFSEVIRSR